VVAEKGGRRKRKEGGLPGVESWRPDWWRTV